MPNIKSAKKRLRQNERQQERNQIRKSRVRSTRRKFREAVEANEKDLATTYYAAYCSALDKAVKTNVVAKNAAIRSKTRGAKALAAISG